MAQRIIMHNMSPQEKYVIIIIFIIIIITFIIITVLSFIVAIPGLTLCFCNGSYAAATATR